MKWQYCVTIFITSVHNTLESETGFEPAFAGKGATPFTDNRLGNELGYSDLVVSVVSF